MKRLGFRGRVTELASWRCSDLFCSCVGIVVDELYSHPHASEGVALQDLRAALAVKSVACKLQKEGCKGQAGSSVLLL